MGHNLSGQVFYGIDLGDDETRTDEQNAALPQWWHGDEDWKNVLAKRLGWEDTAPYPDYNVPGYRKTPEFEAWRANRRDRTDLIALLGVDIDLFGYEYSRQSIRVTETVQSCDWRATRLDVMEFGRYLRLEVWIPQLKKFCELLELPYDPTKVGWYLCASRG